jgi:cellulose synthase/poly-beta-1,6-N-acetylglucosamine synthase-like glycosyltransferase
VVRPVSRVAMGRLDRSRQRAPVTYSFVVLTFNQEQFIEEAMRAALAQRCAPLHVVVSDDASTDTTFRIMERVAKSYRGPHRLTIRRNERNVGLAAHFRLCAELPGTDWVICGAGDDVSEPHRAARIMEVVDRLPCLQGVGSDVVTIDSNGHRIERPGGLGSRLRALLPVSRPEPPGDCRGEARTRDRLLAHLIEGNGFLLGAAAAWRTSLVTDFGPMLTGSPEDFVLSFRASVSGGTCVIPEALVRYRTHSANMWSSATASDSVAAIDVRQERRRRIHVTGIEQCLADLQIYRQRGVIDEELATVCSKVLRLQCALAGCADESDGDLARAEAAVLLLSGVRAFARASGFHRGSIVRRRALRLAYLAIRTVARYALRYRLS